MNAKHYERLQDELSQEKSKPRRTKKKKSWKQMSEEKKNMDSVLTATCSKKLIMDTRKSMMCKSAITTIN